MSKKFTLLLFSLFIMLFLVGCDEEGTGPDALGTFTATITGDIQRSLQGTALFGEFEDEGEKVFAILLIVGTPPQKISASQQDEAGEAIALARLGSRPGTGTMQVGDLYEADYEEDFDPTKMYAFYFLYDGTTGAFVYSTSGSVNITSSSNSRVAGSFTFEAMGYQMAGEQYDEVTVSISGNFDAIAGPVEDFEL